MEWLVFALIGQFIIAFAMIFGKIIRTKIIQSTIIYLIYVGFISSIAFAVIPFVGFEFPTKSNLLLVFLTTIPFTIGLYLLVKTFTVEEVSRISIFRQVQPIFVLILASFFLSESLSTYQYFGFFMLLAGSITASYKYGNLAAPSKGFWLILANTFLWAVYIVMAKFTYTVYGFWNTFILVRAFLLLYSIIILSYLIYKKSFDFKKVLTKGTLYLSLNELMVTVAVSFSQFALSLAPASLVAIAASSNPIFVFIIASIFSMKYPKLLKENLNKKIILQKSVSIILIIIGFVLLTM